SHAGHEATLWLSAAFLETRRRDRHLGLLRRNPLSQPAGLDNIHVPAASEALLSLLQSVRALGARPTTQSVAALPSARVSVQCPGIGPGKRRARYVRRLFAALPRRPFAG